PLQRGQHFEAVIDQPLSHGGAHHAGRDDGDDRSHGVVLRFGGGAARNLLTSRRLGKAVFALAPAQPERDDPASPHDARAAPGRLGNGGHFGFAPAAYNCPPESRKRPCPMTSPMPATRSRLPTAYWRTKACSMRSAMSACAIRPIPVAICSRARARRG